jgi:hypothetical protein
VDLLAQTVKHLDKALTRQSAYAMEYWFKGEEGLAIIGREDWRWWEFWGDRFLAIHLKNGKIIHLSFPSEQERDDQMMAAREWWYK